MADLRLQIKRRLAWPADAQLELWLGSENAVDLAASSPAGGTLARTVDVWPSEAARGGWGVGAAWGQFTWSSNPAGGVGWADSDVVWGQGLWGWTLLPDLVISHEYRPTDVCAALPLGVRVRDSVGERSDVLEGVALLNDAPRGARNLQVAATDNDNEALLSWSASPHVPA